MENTLCAYIVHPIVAIFNFHVERLHQEGYSMVLLLDFTR